jgi:hypothetical protein
MSGVDSFYWLNNKWNAHHVTSNFCLTSAAEFESRPQPKPWSGPQDGLPPVGTVCEIKNERHGRTDKKWITCEIIFSSKHYVIIKSSELVGQDEAVCLPSDLRFRSKDQRETAIREIMDIADVDCRVTAARLVDAEFKREVV